jgi:hypothetical protein
MLEMDEVFCQHKLTNLQYSWQTLFRLINLFTKSEFFANNSKNA